MTQMKTVSIAASWRDHLRGIQAQGLEVEELSFPVQSKKKKKGKAKLRLWSPTDRIVQPTADRAIFVSLEKCFR